jgi:hypothetical protein
MHVRCLNFVPCTFVAEVEFKNSAFAHKDSLFNCASVLLSALNLNNLNNFICLWGWLLKSNIISRLLQR